MPWLPAACFVNLLPCGMVTCLDLYPGSPFNEHLSSAAVLLAAGLLLALKPLPAPALPTAMPEGHRDQLKYAVRSGVLPFASLFSDWRDELAQQARTYSLALRGLPGGTAVVILIDNYGVIRDPAESLFFLPCAVATAALGVALYAFSAARLNNIEAVEGKLREQMRLLDSHP